MGNATVASTPGMLIRGRTSWRPTAICPRSRFDGSRGPLDARSLNRFIVRPFPDEGACVVDRRPTIVDVAQVAGVSKAAVSLAVNGRDGVSIESRERIYAAIESLGWIPSRSARGLSTSRAYALGLVVARGAELLGADPFFAQFIAGVETELSRRGSALLLQFVNVTEEEGTYRRLAKDRRVDGVFLTDLRIEDPRIPLLLSLGMPAVTVNHPQSVSPFPAVNVDDEPAVTAAVKHLVELGHRRIGHVSGPATFVHGAARIRAWAAALKTCGLPRDALASGGFTPRGGARATRRLLDRPDPPTAILFANDLMAIAGIAAARERGLGVPADLSVVGFDDMQLAEHLHPPLSTARVDVFGWGRAAAHVLCQLTDGRPQDDVHLPPAQLILRGSTAHPATATAAGFELTSRRSDRR